MERHDVTYGNTARAALNYRTQDIETSDPLNLVVRVYDEALRNLAQARAALNDERISAKGQAIGKTLRCIALLRSALDVDQGDEVARNLDRLYAYFQRRLVEANLRNDDEPLAEVAGHLVELAAAWREAAGGRLAGVGA